MTTYSSPSADFDSSLADAALGPEAELDHDRVPDGVQFVFGPTFDGTVFGIKSNLLYYCKPKQPEYWPALFYVEVSQPQFPLQVGLLHGGQVYCLSKRDVYYLQGTGNGTFLPFKRDCKTGAQSVQGAVSVGGKGIFHTGPDGIYLFTTNGDVKISEQTLEPIFRGETKNGLPGVATMDDSWLWQYRNNLYFGYRGEDDTYPGNVIVMNLDTNRTSHFVYDDGTPVQIKTIQTDETNKRLLIGDSVGYVRIIDSPLYTSDDGEPIAFDVISKDYLLQTRAHFPRWVKYDIDASEAEEVTGELLLDGESQQEHVITGSRNTRRRLVETGNGERAAIRISGSGPVTIYLTEFE